MIHYRIEPQDIGDDGRHDEDCNCDRCNPDMFECERCGKEIQRDCVDFDCLCALCELESKAQRQLLASAVQLQNATFGAILGRFQ